jgi:hypothetical protein
MSQDDQRNQPNEEPEQTARRAQADAAGDAGAEREREPGSSPVSGAGPAAGGTEPTVVGTPEPTVVGAPIPASEVGPATTGTGATAEPPTGATTDPSTGATTGATTGTGSPAAAPAAATTGATTGATTETGSPAAVAAASPAAKPRRVFQEAGEGAARYAEVPEEVPRSGSEQSWSAQPHPGYQPDPARHVTTRRLMASSLVGLVVLGAGAFFGFNLLTLKSSNGNGPAVWTGAVTQQGAVIGGINAQNNDSAAPVSLPVGATFGNSGTAEGAAVNQAITACQRASTTSVPVTAATGTPAEISAWGNKATPTVDDLHSGAASLQRTLNGTDAVTVANAAYSLCLGYPAVSTVPPMPDAAGSQAWSAAVRAYAQAASQALQGISGKPAQLTAANASINTGNAEVAKLSALVNNTL